MSTVTCSLCSQEMIIDEPDGVPYVTESDGSIHHTPTCPEVTTTDDSSTTDTTDTDESTTAID